MIILVHFIVRLSTGTYWGLLVYLAEIPFFEKEREKEEKVGGGGEF
jgi:hypothetical protein